MSRAVGFWIVRKYNAQAKTQQSHWLRHKPVCSYFAHEPYTAKTQNQKAKFYSYIYTTNAEPKSHEHTPHNLVLLHESRNTAQPTIKPSRPRRNGAHTCRSSAHKQHARPVQSTYQSVLRIPSYITKKMKCFLFFFFKSNAE